MQSYHFDEENPDQGDGSNTLVLEQEGTGDLENSDRRMNRDQDASERARIVRIL